VPYSGRMKNSSQEEYGSESIAQDYAKRSDLQKPERTILGELGTKLSKGSMLDIGVGGGRTTVHFAPLAKQYLGLDYSTEMVEACQSRFGETYEFVEGMYGKWIALTIIPSTSSCLATTVSTISDILTVSSRFEKLIES